MTTACVKLTQNWLAHWTRCRHFLFWVPIPPAVPAGLELGRLPQPTKCWHYMDAHAQLDIDFYFCRFYFFRCPCSYVSPRKSSLNPMSWSFSRGLALILSLLCDTRVQLHLCAHGCLVFPVLCCSKWSWHPCQRWFDFILKSLFLDNCLCFMPVSFWLGYCSFKLLKSIIWPLNPYFIELTREFPEIVCIKF